MPHQTKLQLRMSTNPVHVWPNLGPLHDCTPPLPVVLKEQQLDAPAGSACTCVLHVQPGWRVQTEQKGFSLLNNLH